MDLRQRLCALAPILLEEDAPVFFDALKRADEGDETFRESDDKAGHDLEMPTDRGPLGEIDLQNLFLEVAQNLAYTLWIDWSGEDSTGELETWVDARMNAFSDTFDYAVVDDWEEGLDWEALGRGEYIVEKFCVVGDYLKAKGYALIFFQEGSDRYLPFIIRTQAWTAIPEEVRLAAAPGTLAYPYLHDYQVLCDNAQTPTSAYVVVEQRRAPSSNVS